LDGTHLARQHVDGAHVARNHLADPDMAVQLADPSLELTARTPLHPS
jgi:hypothetical protein